MLTEDGLYMLLNAKALYVLISVKALNVLICLFPPPACCSTPRPSTC